MQPSTSILANNLKFLRYQRRLPVDALLKALENPVCAGMYYRFENGESIPKEDLLSKIAQFYEKTPGMLKNVQLGQLPTSKPRKKRGTASSEEKVVAFLSQLLPDPEANLSPLDKNRLSAITREIKPLHRLMDRYVLPNDAPTIGGREPEPASTYLQPPKSPLYGLNYPAEMRINKKQ